MDFEQVDLNEMVRSALQDHLFSDNSGNIERIIEVHQEGDFLTDKSRLNMVFYNLISNGLKYHNRERDNPFLKIVVNASAKKAEIHVIDNGQGIDESHLEHIFPSFITKTTLRISLLKDHPAQQ